MNLIEMIYEFGDKTIDGPSDYTDRYWTQTTWGIKWTEEGGEIDDEFEYISEYRKMTKTNHYMICTIDSGCGYTYQAVFDLSKEVFDV